jgi:hypothetical protein
MRFARTLSFPFETHYIFSSLVTKRATLHHFPPSLPLAEAVIVCRPCRAGRASSASGVHDRAEDVPARSIVAHQELKGSLHTHKNVNLSKITFLYDAKYWIHPQPTSLVPPQATCR